MKIKRLVKHEEEPGFSATYSQASATQNQKQVAEQEENKKVDESVIIMPDDEEMDEFEGDKAAKLLKN